MGKYDKLLRHLNFLSDCKGKIGEVTGGNGCYGWSYAKEVRDFELDVLSMRPRGCYKELEKFKIELTDEFLEREDFSTYPPNVLISIMAVTLDWERIHDGLCAMLCENGFYARILQALSKYNENDCMGSLENWRFGVVGNIKESHLDENGITRYGTKAFKPKTKVYLHAKNWDEDRTDIGVIGLNRFGRWVFDGVDINLIENVRAQIVRNPKVLEIMFSLESCEGCEFWERTAEDKRESRAFVSRLEEIKANREKG